MLNFVSVIITSLVGIISFILLDYLWLSKIAKNIYLTSLKDHVNLENGALIPYLPAIPLVYIVAVLGIWLFALQKATSFGTAFIWGSVLGFVLYAFYDLTNLATLKDYPWSLTIIDTLWGTLLVGVVTVIVFWVNSLLS